MKALVFHGARRVSVDDWPDPKIQDSRDAILRVTSTAICGSDLHIYNGFFPQPAAMVLGHEFMGIVEETGPAVTNLKKGDRVVVPFPIACGRCWFCERALPVHCEQSNVRNYGPEGGLASQKGGGLFGYTSLYGGYDGGQAEYVRVPFADFGPRKVPEHLNDEQVLFLTDIFPTGWSGIDWAEPKGGETVAIFGAGPVGLMTAKCAWLRGASRVFVVDIEPYRLDMAHKATNAEAIDGAETDAVEAIRAATGGRGADICVDAVGMEAHRGFLKKLSNVVHAEVGTIDTLKACISAVRRGGTVVVTGVYGISYDDFPIGQIFDKGIAMRHGQALVHRYIDTLLDLVEKGKVRLDDIITHRLPLAEAPRGYQVFNDKQEECVKVVLEP